MKKVLSPILLSLLALTSCDETDIAKGAPSCVRQKTLTLERDTPCDEGAGVKEYRFQGKAVYVFDSGNCIADGSAEVTDEDCNTLGYLGGIVGNTTINGEPFANAEFKRTIWEQ